MYTKFWKLYNSEKLEITQSMIWEWLNELSCIH